jgi:pyridoxamine 5'-phosphate oxidase
VSRLELDLDPLALFTRWYTQARASEERADLMALATTDSSSRRPSVRMVELQGFNARGFLFYSGRSSRKALELTRNPQASLCFYWHDSGHQVRIEGAVILAALDASEALEASHTRTTGPTPTMNQGEPITDDRELARRIDRLHARYGDDASPLPSDWGGYYVVPDAYEFWQFRDDHLHDRYRYTLAETGWKIERRFP